MYLVGTSSSFVSSFFISLEPKVSGSPPSITTYDCNLFWDLEWTWSWDSEFIIILLLIIYEAINDTRIILWKTIRIRSLRKIKI